MSKCLRGREVVIAIRRKRKGEPIECSVVCPAHWTKSFLLRYVRAQHPGDSVRIIEWKLSGTDGDPWKQRLWIVNPIDFDNYPRGILKEPAHD